MRIRLLLVAGLFVHASAFAGALVFQSGPGQTHLIELYTSEGCSSCPPAEERVSNFRSDPKLWKEIVPVAFHVDYWNYLGWADRFASPSFTQRQQDYAGEWGSGSVYTPEFVLDGSEFHGGEIPAPTGSAGNLRANLEPTGELTIQYEPAAPSSGAAWEAHIATLGMDVNSDVRAGENGGRRLHHDFIVLHLISRRLDSAGGTASLTLPADGAKAIAIWITHAGKLTPIQATGGWL